LNLSNIPWVTIENPRVGRDFGCYFIATERILIRVQIGDQGVKELVKLHVLRIYNVVIRYECENLIAAKIIATSKWNHGPVPPQLGNRGFMSGLGIIPTKIERVGFSDSSGTELNCQSGPNPERWGLPPPVAYTSS